MGGPTKNKLWLVATQLFLKYALNPFHGQKKKKNLYYRQEVERTALSESGTQVYDCEICNIQLEKKKSSLLN